MKDALNTPVRGLIFLLAFAVFGLTDAVAQMGPGFMMHGMNSEYAFLIEMIPHHEEAVETSQEVIRRTQRPELSAFAENIVRVQSAEIEQMREWLTRWYPERSGAGSYQRMMRPTEGFSADRADRAFLEDMIMHHHMAVMMATRLIRGNVTQRPELIRFAEGIIETQNREIEQMEVWLEEWYDVSFGGHMMGPGFRRR